jgi:hypothetical protein
MKRPWAEIWRNHANRPCSSPTTRSSCARLQHFRTAAKSHDTEPGTCLIVEWPRSHGGSHATQNTVLHARHCRIWPLYPLHSVNQMSACGSSLLALPCFQSPSVQLSSQLPLTLVPPCSLTSNLPHNLQLAANKLACLLLRLRFNVCVDADPVREKERAREMERERL